jgi:hypothetical protein
MSRTYASDYAWQLTFQQAQRQILTETFAIPDCDVTFTTPDSYDDRRANTDAWVMIDGKPKRVSLRMRRYVVGDEFTLRYARPQSATEWQKVSAGFGDFFLYGRGTDRRSIEDWFVGALDVFRRWVDSYLSRGTYPPHQIKPNKDGSSEFVAFSLADLPARPDPRSANRGGRRPYVRETAHA